MSGYTVYRFAFKGGREVMAEGLTREEAQEMCQDPETSSRTCSEERLASEECAPPWFYGFEGPDDDDEEEASGWDAEHPRSGRA